MTLQHLSRALPLLACGFALALLLNWFAGDSYGQQPGTSRLIPRPASTGARISSGTFSMQGSLHVKILDPIGREEYFETATKLVLQDEWALVTVIENEEEAVVVYPREKINFVKVWEVKQPVAPR